MGPTILLNFHFEFDNFILKYIGNFYNNQKENFMYLKNVSSTCTCIINTVVGKVCIKPGEVINLVERILPPVSSNVVKTTEEEYLLFQEGRKSVMEQVIEQVEQEDNETENTIEEVPVTPPEQTDIVIETPQTPVVSQTTLDNLNNIQNNPMVDFVQNLFNKDSVSAEVPLFAETEETVIEEVPVIPPEPQNEEALQTKETTQETEKEKLQQEIKDLQDTWIKTRAAKTKERLGKQIKELKKQLEKLL